MVEKKLNNKKSTKKSIKKIKNKTEEILVEEDNKQDSIKQDENKTIKEHKKNSNFFSKTMSFFHF